MSHEDEGTLAPTVTPQPRRLSAEGPVEALPTAATERYVMDRELGQGGQSVVFAAKDQALGREVAFKTARRRGDEASTFVREARLTGQLEHPGIVPVHELGRTETGEYFCTQKLVRGRTLRVALEDAQTLEARLALLPHFIDLCHAVAYAHSRGVVHRDLKPENVMVGEFGETVVLDWGIARVLGAPETLPAENTPTEQVAPLRTVRRLDVVRSGSTQRGAVMGTPVYMSPEQARGENEQVDARSDVWSLGVMLYELLAFSRPFEANDVRTLLLDVGRGHCRPLRDVAPDAPPELVAIVEQAMQIDRDRRPPDARALAAQLSDFRAGKRVAAYQYSSGELVSRFVSRNRALTAVTVLALVVLGVSEIYAWAQVDARDRALDAAHAARRESLVTQAHEAERSREWTRAWSLRGAASQPRAQAVLAPWAAPLIRQPGEVPTSASGPGSFDVESGHALLASASGVFSARGAEAWRLLEGTSDPERRTWPNAIAPGGAWWVTRGTTLRLNSGVTLPGTEQALAVAFSPDGSRLAVALAGAVRVHDAAQGTLVRELSGAPAEPTALALSARGDVAVAGADGPVRAWRGSVPAAQALPLVFGRRLVSLAFSIDGLLLFGGDEEGGVQVLSAESGALLRVLSSHRLPVQALLEAPDGRTLATASLDGRVVLWDLATWQVLSVLQAEGVAVRALSYSRDGVTLGALLRSGERLSWNLAGLHAARPVTTLLDGPATALFAGKDGTLWVRTARGLSLLSPQGDVLWTRDGVHGGEALVTELGLLVGKPGQLDLHSTTDGEVLESMKPCRATVWAVANAVDGSAVWLACGTELRVFERDATESKATGIHARAPLRHLALSPTGERLAWSAEDGSGGLVALPAGREEESWSGRMGQALRFDSKGASLLTAGEEGVALRHGVSGVELRRLTTSDLRVSALGFAFDDTVAWAAGADGVHLWTVADGTPLMRLPGLHGELTAAAPTEDGTGLWLADTTGRLFRVEAPW